MESGILTCFLHQPIRLREFSFLEIGSAKPYHNSLQYQVDALFWKERLPVLLDQFSDDFSDWLNTQRVKLAITGFTVDWLIEWAPTTLVWLKKWQTSHQIPLCQTPYLHTSAAWLAPDLFEEAIGQSDQIIKKLFPQARQSNQQADYVVNLFQKEFAHTATPVTHLSDRLLKSGWKAVQPAMQSWSTDWHKKPVWLLNQLQQSALEAWYSLRSMIKKKRNDQISDQWHQLGAMELLFDMCTEMGSSTNAPAFERYISYMNMLGDLKQRLA